ncbi:MAG: tyrosine-type recombinase/integrase, partial [Dysgonamonadaceae bacterium]|nr:tyrosine-type recombinase/integrase [Dysgonamonadaceae bacterium]
MTIGEIIPVYITYRQSLGEKFKTNGIVLTGFCRHVGSDVELDLIDWNIISEYLYAPKGKVTSFLFGKYSALKGFYAWALSRGYVAKVPLSQELPKQPAHMIPYIYSDLELKSLFESALTYQKRKGHMIPYVTQTILIMTYVLGLRKHEALVLKLKDVDMQESLVVIRESKFYKSRIVPFNEDVKRRMEEYLEWREKSGFPQEPESALFIDDRALPVNIHTFSACFKHIRKKAGISRDDGGIYQPRIQDLR